MNNKKESFFKGIFALILSQVLIKIIGLAYKLYLTNREGFGDSGNAIYSSGFQIYALLLTFSSTGVPNAISKLVSERVAIGDNKGAHRIFKISFFMFALIGGIGTTLLFMFAKRIATNWIQIPEAEQSLIALSPSIFFVSLISVFRGYFNGIQKFSATAKSQSIEQFFKTVATIILVECVVLVCGTNTTLMAAGANLATSIATVVSFIYIYCYYISKRSEIAQDIKSSANYIPTRIRKTMRKIIGVAFPISLSSLMSSFSKNIDSFTVVRFLKEFMKESQAKQQYGILSGKIDILCALPLSINVALVTTLVPNIAKEVAKKNYEEVRKKARLFLLFSMVIGLPATVGMMIFSNQILNLLFPNASEGADLLRWGSVSIIFMIMLQTINAILQGIGEVKVPSISLGIGTFFKFICNIFLIRIPEIGIYGAIIGNIVCNVIATLIGYFVLIRKINLKLNLKTFFLKPIIATICMGSISNFVYYKLNRIIISKMATILSLVLAVIVYIICIIMLRIFKKNDIKIL